MDAPSSQSSSPAQSHRRPFRYTQWELAQASTSLGLTSREIDILTLLVNWKTPSEIAATLGLSEAYIRKRIHSMVRDRAKLRGGVPALLKLIDELSSPG